jgi:hypothetical protein
MAGDYGSAFSVPVSVKYPSNEYNSMGHADRMRAMINQAVSETNGSEPANDADAGEYGNE